jgi:hypothetical protein
MSQSGCLTSLICMRDVPIQISALRPEILSKFIVDMSVMRTGDDCKRFCVASRDGMLLLVLVVWNV